MLRPIIDPVNAAPPGLKRDRLMFMQTTNRLIDALPRQARERVLASCAMVDLAFGTVLNEPGVPTNHVYFPLNAFFALVTNVEPHKAFAMALIGNEGMLGASLLLDVDDAPLRGVVFGAGSALRMSTAQFRREINDSGALSRLLKRYVYVLLLQIAQSSACGRFHQVDARLARSLLLIQDCVHADRFSLTHALLADMLGVRRSAVSIAAGALQRHKLIRYSRGEITILSRTGLERQACSCYAAATANYAYWLE
jgi:hypothetical protein